MVVRRKIHGRGKKGAVNEKEERKLKERRQVRKEKRGEGGEREVRTSYVTTCQLEALYPYLLCLSTVALAYNSPADSNLDASVMLCLWTNK